MDMSMPPPARPGFSLRVKLFSPLAAKENDRPIRCFRVVASASMTVGEFCQEASRVHEINYGDPLAIKKCTDDELFDITQSDSISALFTNMGTIRIVQAPAQPSIRDSVPPSSALRFDSQQYNGRKRRFDNLQGLLPSNDWMPTKRQRIAGGGPDDPLPSREAWAEGGNVGRDKIPAGFHRSSFYANQPKSSVGRDMTPRVSETPSPEHRRVLRSPILDGRPRTSQSNMARTFVPESSPPIINRDQDGSQRRSVGARGATYHIERATEQGTSVSTDATSPPSPNKLHERSGSKKRQMFDSTDLEPNTKRTRTLKSHEFDNSNEKIESDVEFSGAQTQISGSKRVINGVKPKPQASDNDNIRTPSTGSRRSREPMSASGKLPLTPSSKEREKEQALRRRSEGSAHLSSVEAKGRKAEPGSAQQKAAGQRLEQQKRAESEQRKEQIKLQSQAAMAAKAARLEKERESERIRVQDVGKEDVDSGKQYITMEVAHPDEVQTSAEGSENVDVLAPSAKAGAKSTKSPGTPKTTKASGLNKSTPTTSIRPPPSTSHIPSGRRSALKGSRAASSPMDSSGEASNKVGINAQMPLPKQKKVVLKDSEEKSSNDEAPRRPVTTSVIEPPPRRSTTRPPADQSAKPSDDTTKANTASALTEEGGVRDSRAMLSPSLEASSSPEIDQSASDAPTRKPPSNTYGKAKKPIVQPVTTGKDSTLASGAAKVHKDIMPPLDILKRLERRNSTPMRLSPAVQPKLLKKDIAAADKKPKAVTPEVASNRESLDQAGENETTSGKQEATEESVDPVAAESSSDGGSEDGSEDGSEQTDGHYPDETGKDVSASVTKSRSSPNKTELSDTDEESASEFEAGGEDRDRTPVVHVQQRSSTSQSVENDPSLENEEDAFKSVSETDDSTESEAEGEDEGENGDEVMDEVKVEDEDDDEDDVKVEDEEEDEDEDQDSDEADEDQIASQLLDSGDSKTSLVPDSQIQASVSGSRTGNNQSSKQPTSPSEKASNSSQTTQDEVDQQLTSSLQASASSAVSNLPTYSSRRIMPPSRSQPAIKASTSILPAVSKSSPIASKSSTPKPTGPQYGASLSSLNRNKPKLGPGVLPSSQLSRSASQSQLSASQRLAQLQKRDDDDDEASESESDEDSDEDIPTTKKPKLSVPLVNGGAKEMQKNKKWRLEESDSEDSDDDPDKMEMDVDMLQAQKALERQVAKMTAASPVNGEKGKALGQRFLDRGKKIMGV